MITNATAKVKRYQRVSEDATIRDYVEVGTEKVFLAPSGDETRPLATEYGILGKAYDCFFYKKTDIKKGDQLEIRDDKYDVRGVKDFFSGGGFGVLHAITEKKE